MFGMSQQYFKRGLNGFTSAIITGERRVGKTSYSMWTVYQICRKKGMSEEASWETARKAVVFTMKEVIDVVIKTSYKNRKDFMIWDDCGVYGSGLLYWYNIKNAAALKGIMDTIGTKVRFLLLTCPDSSGLMKFLRNYGDYIVQVEPYHKTYGNNGRLATVKRPYIAKNMSRRWARAWNDEFNVQIPDSVYRRYIKKRDKYTNIIIKELMGYGKDGEDVIRENLELVGQDSILADVVPPDNEGDDTSSGEQE